MNLHEYKLVVINSSAGKDSLCSIWEINRLAEMQRYPKSQIIISHQILQEEWPGTKELAIKQAELFGYEIYFSKRRTKDGYEETLLEYVKRRGKWPSNDIRYCTSDFKRGPGARVVTALTKTWKEIAKVLYIFGFRKEESPARSKKKKLTRNQRMTTRKRIVDEYLPIHDWPLKKVWNVIKGNNLPYHYAYDLGMPRLSCCFCIFSPFDALVLAGIHNPKLLDEYIEVEEITGHSFKNGSTIADIRKVIETGYVPKQIENWRM